VPAQDPDALAEKLRLIFVNHDLRARLGEQAVVYAHDFSWELITDQIVDVYKKILSS
jgi:glycosyltransferase involved in cell wall biosynthesis